MNDNSSSRFNFRNENYTDADLFIYLGRCAVQPTTGRDVGRRMVELQ